MILTMLCLNQLKLQFPFRSTKKGALSYFVGGDLINDGYMEDKGFAINSGKCWSNVEFFKIKLI